jgi:hypothetical protein
MTVSLKAIRPSKFKTINAAVTKQAARDGIKEYLNEVKQIMKDNYNTAQEGKYKRRNTGKRGGYTGVGGSWVVSVRSHNFGVLTNDAKDERGRPLAAFVQGPRRGRVGPDFQSQEMRDRGWKPITDVVRATAKRYEEIMNRKIRGGVF